MNLQLLHRDLQA